MKTLLPLLLVIMLSSCKSHQKNDNDRSKHIVVKDDIQKTAVWQYADSILSGKVQASDDERTFALFDSLQSKNKATRQLTFEVYKAISLKADGALAEGMGNYIKSYFQYLPGEFLSAYHTLPGNQKQKLLEDFAYEFYASGNSSQQDINGYFKSIEDACNDCSFENKNALKDIRIKVIALAIKYKD